MGKRRVKSDVFNGEDQEIGGDMPKKFMRIMRTASKPVTSAPKNITPNPPFDHVRPGESFSEYNSRLAKAGKQKGHRQPAAEIKENPKSELYLKPSLVAALGDLGKKPVKPIRQKRKEFLQKRKEKKRQQLDAKKQLSEQTVHQSAVPRPLRDVVKEPPKLKPNK